MDNAKVKNYIIIVLALVNAFLLAIVLTNARQAYCAAADRKQVLEAVLSNNGIKLSKNVKLTESVPPQLSLKRDTTLEKNMLAALLGETEVTDLGGNVYSYKGKNGGEAKFRGTGDFTILLGDENIKRGKDPAQTAKNIIKELDLTCSGEQPEVSGSSSDTTITLSCAWKNYPIYNARVSFRFSSTCLRLITGRRPFKTQAASSATGDYPDGITVLMNFLQSTHTTGDICTEIRGLDIGYFVSSSISGDCTLRPFWCVQTDSHAYYIDAQTGQTETPESSTQ